MNLIVIYGPPATGKLTVAREIEKMTGIKIFDNHATVDLALRLFKFRSPAFNDTVNGIRMKMIEGAAKEGIDLIFTTTWLTGDYSNAHELDDAVGRYGGKVCYVYLTASRDELLRRVEGESRKNFGKIKDRATLEEFLRTHEVPAKAPIPGSHHIDTTKQSPSQTAQDVVRYFGLKDVRVRIPA